MWDLNNNSFIGYYINDYNIVLNSGCPTNGSAVLFADLNKNMLYTKKLVNGVPMISTFELKPVQNTNTSEGDDSLNIILEKLKKLEERIESANVGTITKE